MGAFWAVGLSVVLSQRGRIHHACALYVKMLGICDDSTVTVCHVHSVHCDDDGDELTFLG